MPGGHGVCTFPLYFVGFLTQFRDVVRLNGISELNTHAFGGLASSLVCIPALHSGAWDHLQVPLSRKAGLMGSL